MDDIIAMLQLYHIKFEKVDATTLRIYGNFRGYSVIRKAGYGSVEVDGKLKTMSVFEDWLFAISV